MRRDGSLDNEGDLKDFSLGFTQGKATFDFVDVGHGKERADNKIKGKNKRRPMGSSYWMLTRKQKRLGGICETTTANKLSLGFPMMPDMRLS